MTPASILLAWAIAAQPVTICQMQFSWEDHKQYDHDPVSQAYEAEMLRIAEGMAERLKGSEPLVLTINRWDPSITKATERNVSVRKGDYCQPYAAKVEVVGAETDQSGPKRMAQ